MTDQLSNVTLLGHPFSTTGVGEQMRSHVRAATSVGLNVQVLDIYRYASRADRSHIELLQGLETVALGGEGTRIFHINGDEIDPAFNHLGLSDRLFAAGHNVIVPAWELPTYPKAWADKLRRFDEVWALSHFIEASLAAAGVASKHVGQSVQVPRQYFLSRRFFGIREDAFCFLTFFDRTSFFSRKNPQAVLEFFSKIVRRKPFLNVQLVLKVKDGDRDAASFIDEAGMNARDVKIIAKPLSQFETHSLINACDCFVSLHRAEGFGRGSGEAMSLGRLALATGWSGNMDYMNERNSLIANYELIPLVEGDYPHWEGQTWAEPDIDHAVTLVERAIEDTSYRRSLCRQAKVAVARSCGDRVVGLRMLEHLASRKTKQ